MCAKVVFWLCLTTLGLCVLGTRTGIRLDHEQTKAPNDTEDVDYDDLEALWGTLKNTQALNGKEYPGFKKFDKNTKRLHKLTRLLNQKDARTLPYLYPDLSEAHIRPSDKKRRINSPFEHICGGNAKKASSCPEGKKKCNGKDGPSNFISFSNAGEHPKVAKDCDQPWDKGQQRVWTSAEAVARRGGLVFDMSKKSEAEKWCIHGGCVKTAKGRELCFPGAMNVTAWPYICAQRAYHFTIKRDDVMPPNAWWGSERNRQKNRRKLHGVGTASSRGVNLAKPRQDA